MADSVAGLRSATRFPCAIVPVPSLCHPRNHECIRKTCLTILIIPLPPPDVALPLCPLTGPDEGTVNTTPGF